jgi:hypothetical protein
MKSPERDRATRAAPGDTAAADTTAGDSADAARTPLPPPRASRSSAPAAPGDAHERDEAWTGPATELVGTTAAEEGFHRRTRALLRSAPVHRLAELASRQLWEHAESFDLRVLSLAAMDDVMARQGLTSEHTYDSLVEFVSAMAAIAEPTATDDEHRDVGKLVVEGLLNLRDQTPGQKFDVAYSDYRVGHVQRHERFWLLIEKARPDGRVVVELSPDAINAFRGGLDLDVEDAQMATEYTLQAQIERNHLPDAEVTAQYNRQLSLELAAKVKGLLDATRADVDQVDWAEDVLNQLARARDHVGERSHVEESLLAHLAAGDEVRDPDLRGHAARVVSLLEECLSQHRRLHSQLIAAPDIFYFEQQRQALRRRGRGVGLFATRVDILDPVLVASRSSATDLGVEFALTTLGPRSPKLPRLYDLLDSMLAPRRESDAALPDEEWDVDDVDDEIEEFPAETVHAATRVLAECDIEPRRLSELLVATEQLPLADADRGRVADLVRLAVLWGFAPEFDDDTATVATELIGPDMAVVTTGETFEAAGFAGDDLLVGSIHLLADHLDDDSDTDSGDDAERADAAHHGEAA